MRLRTLSPVRLFSTFNVIKPSAGGRHPILSVGLISWVVKDWKRGYMYEEYGAIVYWQPREEHWIAETSGMEICRGYGESRLEALESLEAEVRQWEATRQAFSPSRLGNPQQEMDFGAIKEEPREVASSKIATSVPPLFATVVRWWDNILEDQQRSLIELRQRLGGYNVRVDEEGTIFLAGEVDFITSPKLETTINALIDAGAVIIIVDLADVSYMDASGLGILVKSVRHLQTLRGASAGVVLTAPNGTILRLLRLTRLDTILPVYNTIQEAKVALSSQR